MASEASRADLAAHDYEQLVPTFYDKTKRLSANQLRRVIRALIEYPFMDGRPKFSYPEEAEAFIVGMNIFDCKFVMIKAGLEMTLDEQKALKAEIASTEAEGVTNG